MSVATGPRSAGTAHLGVVITGIAAVVAAVVLVVLVVLPVGENGEHAAGHLFLAVPFLALLFVGVRRWSGRSFPMVTRLAHLALTGGLGLAAFGLAMESMGAFGYRGDDIAVLVALHGVGATVWPWGLLLTVLGAIMSGGVALGGRLGTLGRSVTWIATALLLVSVLLYVLGALVGAW